MKTRTKIFMGSIVFILSAVITFTLLSIYLEPSEKAFELKHSEVPGEITLGQEFSATGILKNKQFLVHSVTHSGSFIKIGIRKAEEECNYISTSESNTKILLILETERQIQTFKPEEKGGYVIDIMSYFIKGEKNYGYHKEIRISVV